MSTHIESKLEDISSVVLMPGDPKRCEYIARKFLANSKIVNNVRGMTAYTGFYKSKKITVFPSGMGCPSMGIYSYELFKEYNVDTIIRIGTMGGYTDLKLKDIVLVDNSITNSNYGKYLCNYPNININDKVAKYNVLGVEMESFALFTNAKLLNKKAATLLMVSDSFIYPDKLSSLEREQGLDNLITLALETSLKL